MAGNSIGEQTGSHSVPQDDQATIQQYKNQFLKLEQELQQTYEHKSAREAVEICVILGDLLSRSQQEEAQQYYRSGIHFARMISEKSKEAEGF